MSARGISKSYGGIHALRNVDFDVRSGMVTVLFGENGAGKSTLMKILSGVEIPSDGVLSLDGEEVAFSSTSDAVDRGVAIIHQELNLAPNLSVADNIFLGRELLGTAGVGVQFAQQRARTIELLELLEEDIRPETLVESLRLGQQQLVEIAKALAGEARILIMDEPTSALSRPEVEVLFRVIEELKRDGVGIVYISHHLEEAIEIADYAVVLRDGELIASSEADKVDLRWVIRNMVGRANEVSPVDLGDEFGEVALDIRNLVVNDPTQPDRQLVSNFNLTVREGEIVCLYGLMGAGRTELLETLAGRLVPSGGTVLLGTDDVTYLGISGRIERGLALVPEDRQRDGLVQTLSVAANLTLASLSHFIKGAFVSEKEEQVAVGKQIGDVRLKTPSPSSLVTALSGGNQQKVVIGKVLMTGPKVLLLDEPSRGIDVGAKAEIFTLIAAAASRGLAILYATSEVGEALEVSHRLVVMSRGRITAEFDHASATRELVMAASEDMTSPGGENPVQSETNRGEDK